MPITTEVVFDVEEARGGGHLSLACAYRMFMQADSVEDLHVELREAVACYVNAAAPPRLIRLHFAHDEALAA